MNLFFEKRRAIVYETHCGISSQAQMKQKKEFEKLANHVR